MHRTIGWLATILLTVAACQQAPEAGAWKQLDLLKYGMPIFIQGPDSLDISSTTYGNMMDLRVRGQGEVAFYQLQVSMLTAVTNDLPLRKLNQIEEVRNELSFTRIIEEDEHGFIYELVPDTDPVYSFRYVHLQGDQEYIIRPALGARLTEEQARRLYAACQQP